jgi:hypothetical protein
MGLPDVQSANNNNVCRSLKHFSFLPSADAVNTKGGSITVPLTSCLTGLD